MIGDELVSEQVAALAKLVRNHIFCDCRPNLMFCGVVCPPGVDSDVSEMPDGDECPDCYLVWICGYCPGCGNHWTVDDYRARGL
jgi:hypothetical protein